MNKAPVFNEPCPPFSKASFFIGTFAKKKRKKKKKKKKTKETLFFNVKKGVKGNCKMGTNPSHIRSDMTEKAALF
jgi:hypothetical protein